MIFDLSGRLVKQERLQGNERYSLENGIYTVVMEDSVSGNSPYTRQASININPWGKCPVQCPGIPFFMTYIS